MSSVGYRAIGPAIGSSTAMWSFRVSLPFRRDVWSQEQAGKHGPRPGPDVWSRTFADVCVTLTFGVARQAAVQFPISPAKLDGRP